nr:hypothetical protein [Pseudonocardiales bacterium]
ARQRWAATREPRIERVRLDAPGTLAELRALGRRGNVVVGWAHRGQPTIGAVTDTRCATPG